MPELNGNSGGDASIFATGVPFAGRFAHAAVNDCVQGTSDGCGDTRASSQDCAQAMPAGRAPGCPCSRDRSCAWLSAKTAGARAGMPAPGNNTVLVLEDVAGTPCHKTHIACYFPLNTLRTHEPRAESVRECQLVTTYPRTVAAWRS